MREHERRYRTSIGKSDSETQRARYRAASDKKEATKKNRQMTYDDYLAEVKDGEKFFEVSDDTRWDEIRENIRSKIRVYSEWVKANGPTYAQTAYTKARGYARIAWSWAQKQYKTLRARYSTRQLALAGGASIAVLVLLGGLVSVFTGSDGTSEQTVAEGTVQGASSEPTIDFDPVLPSTVEEDAVFIDARQGVASFRDQIGLSTVTVSQQPLTEEQKADRAGQLELISVQLLSDVSFATQFGTTYLTNTAPDGTASQVVMFTTDDLLVFIRTPGTTIAVDDWVEYINTIETN